MNKLQLESLRKWLQYPDEFEYMMVGDKIQAIPNAMMEDVQHLQHHLYLKNDRSIGGAIVLYFLLKYRFRNNFI